MAITLIHISKSASGVLGASPNSAPFNTGDTVTFVSASGAEDALISFSDNAADAIALSLDGPVKLAGGASVSFQVTGAAKGGCCALVASKGHEGTPDCKHLPPGSLQITTTDSDRPAPGDPVQR